MVIWAAGVPDRNGIVKPVERPLLITSVHPTDKKASFVAHVISTRKDNADSDPVVEMPWNADTGDTTGLYEWCAVVLRWFVVLEQDQVTKVSGQVSDAFLDDVLQKIADARDYLR
jgi:hypothetical protein